MRRRDIVAGIGSVGVLAGAGGVLLGGLPSFGADRAASASDEDADGPIAIETIDAPGSEAGTVTVPNDGVTVAMLFVTGCGFCQAHVSDLAEARSRLAADHGEAVTFLAATYQSADREPPAELRAWWRDHGGTYAVGYDPKGDIAAEYGAAGYPVTLVVDERGEKRWEKLGTVAPETIVEAVEPVLEASGEEAAGPSTGDERNESTTGERNGSTTD